MKEATMINLRWTPVVTALGLLLSPCTSLQAQQNPSQVCRSVYAKYMAKETSPIAIDSSEGCADFAGFVAAKVGSRLFRKAAESHASDTAFKSTPRKLQSTRTGQANASGVPGQGDAIPSAQPTALASAALSAAGTDDGTKTIATITLNPVTLFGGGDTTASARWSRVGDLSVLVPVSNAGSDQGKLGYFGLRLRVNFTGLHAGDQLLKDVNAVFKQTINQRENLRKELESAFEEFKDTTVITQCADAVIASPYGTAPDECKSRVSVGFTEKTYDNFRQKLALAREKADAKYFGLDLRFDTGDPTLSGDETKEVNAIQAGIAFGRRSVGSKVNAAMFGLQGRIGTRYSSLKSQSDSVVWAVEGALGFEASRLVSNTQAVKFSAGLEGRYSNKSEAVATEHQTDNLVVRGGLEVPLVGGTSVVVAFSGPLTGNTSPTLSVNFNWGLLMSALPSGDD